MDTKDKVSMLDREIDEKGIDDSDRAALKEILPKLQEILDFAYEDEKYNENDLYNILAEDDELQEELVDKLAALNIVLMGYENGDISDEDAERTYLALIDTMFGLSKAINPVGGFGKDRLMSGLSILEYFEKNMWPVSTRITDKNVEAFKEFIPEEHFDDVVCGRKRAIGALRHIGDESYAAGAVVFSVDNDIILDIPRLRLEWIEVHEEMRSQGVGNMLMAEILEPFVKGGDFALVTALPIIKQDEDNMAEADMAENFLASWRIEFSVTSGRRFFLDNSAIKKNKGLSGSYENALTLSGLGNRGADMVRDFFRKQNKDYDREFMGLPFSFYDPYISTCTVENGRITALFLVHRFESGNFRYEALRCPKGYDSPEFKRLLSCAYESFAKRGENGSIFGFFDSEEGRDAVTELFPETRLPMYFSGELLTPEQPVTMEMWTALRHEAGFSDDKIPDEGISEEEMTEEDAGLLKGAIEEMLA